MPVDHSRDALLTDFGKATLKDRYLMPDESFQDLFKRVSSHFSNDEAHAERLYDYMSKTWFMPSTPILSNGGTSRGLSISCFLSEAGDSMESIQEVLAENFWLACRGGGIGSYFGNIRSIGERVKNNGKTSGVIPFLKIQDAQTLAVSQGSLRRGSAAIYMPIDHPEIEEFIEMRRASGGDPNRKCPNLHHGVVITDKFMQAVEKDKDFDLLSPKDQKVVHTVKARDLWARLLTTRVENGEPYLMFVDTINKFIPPHHRELGLKVKMSNLCTEITLPTGPDHEGMERTAVCCLASVNFERFDEWQHDSRFITDVCYFLDNVLQEFIDKAPDTHAKAKYSAMRERSIGLGAMGLHGYYQSKSLAWDSPAAFELNIQLHQHLFTLAQEANVLIAADRGSCPDAVDAGYEGIRFSNVISIAPTASISIICGGATPGDEPTLANFFLHKTLSGSFGVRNQYLEALLESMHKNTDDVWSSIATNEGSVQHLDFLDEHHKAVFRTAEEIDQMDIITQAADRQPFICQSQSINVFLPPTVSKRYLHSIHFKAWQMGLKTLYYCRSKSAQRAEKPSEKVQRVIMDELRSVGADCPDGVCAIAPPAPPKYEACEACQ